ncbi:MAG: cell division protein SepF [Oscillospiraceae bacterium]|jgi:SepF-like predicted cell division protein (DUF552 family)|nr:cell division protein SepF [Oscillospiraceae bacterium]
MNPKGFLDRIFRGSAVTDEDYAAELETEEDAPQAGYRESAFGRQETEFAAENEAPFGAKRDNVVDFTRARASGIPPEPPEEFSRSGSFEHTRTFGESGGKGGGFSGGGGGGFKSSGKAEAADAYVVFKRLKDFQQASQVADRLIDGKIVILNLESCDPEVARRVMDFIGGVAYSCSSMIKRIAGRVFMFTPKGVNSDGEFFDEVSGVLPDIRYDD